MAIHHSSHFYVTSSPLSMNFSMLMKKISSSGHSKGVWDTILDLSVQTSFLAVVHGSLIWSLLVGLACSGFSALL